MEDTKFNYRMLSRLKMDCDYFLGYGNRSARCLWANTIEEHIAYMKELYDGFKDNAKPEWCTYEQILDYEREMKS